MEWQPAPPLTAELALRMFRVRLLTVPMSTLFFLFFLAFDPAPWKLAVGGATTLAVSILSVEEYLRVRRSPVTTAGVSFNIIGTILLMSVYGYLSGGIESPLLAGFVAAGIMVAVVVGEVRIVLPVMLFPIGVTLLFAAGATGGWLPRPTPAVFGLGAGFWNSPVYVWTRAGFLVFLAIAVSIVTTHLRRHIVRAHLAADDARRQALEGMEARNRDLVSVANTIAHELKNPLASLQGLAQLMAKAAPPGGKEAERLEVMLREIHRMRDVVDEFRSFARPLTELARRAVDLDQLVYEVCALNQGLAHARGVQLDPCPAGGPMVSCDPQKIKQALVNLVQNGLEAAPARSRVAVRIQPHASEVAVVVEDAGPGLPAAALELRPGFTTKEHGSGIGLVVTRAIIEQHGGRLALAARDGGGTTATLFLPAAVPT
jgi:signal transduction histidine kinase